MWETIMIPPPTPHKAPVSRHGLVSFYPDLVAWYAGTKCWGEGLCLMLIFKLLPPDSPNMSGHQHNINTNQPPYGSYQQHLFHTRGLLGGLGSHNLSIYWRDRAFFNVRALIWVHPRLLKLTQYTTLSSALVKSAYEFLLSNLSLVVGWTSNLLSVSSYLTIL